MIDEDNSKRPVCEGCRTGNYYLCKSFPGKASEHAQREIEYRKSKIRRMERAGGRFIGGTKIQVYRRGETEAEPQTEADEIFASIGV